MSTTGTDYQQALLSKKREILAQSAQRQDLSPGTNTRQGDMVDQTASPDVHINIKLRQTDSKILQAIEDALTRIDRGTYGMCRECGEPIAPARLNAIPWVRVCITCKEKRST